MAKFKANFSERHCENIVLTSIELLKSRQMTTALLFKIFFYIKFVALSFSENSFLMKVFIYDFQFLQI